MRKRSYGLVLFMAAILFSLVSVRSARHEGAAGKSVFLPFSQARDLADLPSSRNGVLSFIGDSVLGYIDTAADRLYALPYQGRAVIDDQGWISYDSLATDLQLHGTDGRGRTLPAYAYPWFKALWRILVRGDQMGIARIDEQGTIVWEKEFSMPITALDASSRVIAVGLLDGSLHILDTHGKLVFIAPAGFQEVRTVYGVAVSGDSRYVVVLKGLSPQKIETYRQSESSYAKISESNLRQQAVLQASMAFAEDDSHVILARGNQLLYYNVKGNYIRQIELNTGQEELPGKGEDVQFFTLKSTGGATVAVLQIQASDPPGTGILILKHGLLERVAPDAVSISGGQGGLAIVYKDGVELVKGWQP
jgi:hypothetical protein